MDSVMSVGDTEHVRSPEEAAAAAARLREDGAILTALARACGCKCFRAPDVEVYDGEFVNVTVFEGFCAAAAVMNDWFVTGESSELVDGLGFVAATGGRKGCGRHLNPTRRRDRGGGHGRPS